MLEILGETLEAGAVVGGAYRLARIVGEGGMGVVWAAHELRTNQLVALKFLRAGRETDPNNQQRFLREARAAMGIAHPNIARVHAVLETDAGVPFMVMDLLEGESLRALLDRRGILTSAECALLMLQVVDAVAAAHASGVVHRDLKPENVFLSGGTHVRVLDFGIAKRIAKEGDPGTPSLTSTGMLLGTPLYMAPEQIFGERDIDARADVWSLGIVLYECLAGRRPTDGDGFGPIIKRITTGDLLPLEQARSGLPGRITRIVGRMLSRRREDRPSLAELHDVLLSVVQMGDQPTPSARDPIGNLPTAPFPSSTTAGSAAAIEPRTKPAPVAAIVASGVVLLLLGAGVAFRFGRPLFARSVPAPPGSGNVSAATLDLVAQASSASQRRDGPGCLRLLDQLDAAKDRFTLVSTDPSSPNATMRASCMGMSGDCEGGKALYARAYAIQTASSKPTPTTLADANDMYAATWCEGTAMTPRDALLRANSRLSTAPTRKVTAAECHEWYATAKKLIPVVKPRGPSDYSVTAIPLGIEDQGATCLANAGACAEAFAMFRADWARKSPPGALDPKTWEKNAVAVWATRSGPTVCKGKP